MPMVDSFRPAGCAEFRQDRADVKLRYVFGDIKPRGDLLIPQAKCHQAQDHCLSCRQMLGKSPS
jgi:hypothetical protein